MLKMDNPLHHWTALAWCMHGTFSAVSLLSCLCVQVWHPPWSWRAAGETCKDVLPGQFWRVFELPSSQNDVVLSFHSQAALHTVWKGQHWFTLSLPLSSLILHFFSLLFPPLGNSERRKLHRDVSLWLPCRVQPRLQLCREHQLCLWALDRLWQACFAVLVSEGHGEDQHGHLCQKVPTRAVGDVLSRERAEEVSIQEQRAGCWWQRSLEVRAVFDIMPSRCIFASVCVCVCVCHVAWTEGVEYKIYLCVSKYVCVCMLCSIGHVHCFPGIPDQLLWFKHANSGMCFLKLFSQVKKKWKSLQCKNHVPCSRFFKYLSKSFQRE